MGLWQLNMAYTVSVDPPNNPIINISPVYRQEDKAQKH